MKKVLSFVLLLCMAFSLCVLTGCKNNSVDHTENIYADLEEFDSFVPSDSDIIGTWTMTSPDSDQEWRFFANTTLHQTKITGETRMSTVCTYNYDGEGNLKIYVFNTETESAYTVEIQGSNLTLTDKDGAKSTFTKQ